MPTIKEKKPSGLVFSLCKMSALVRMTERTAIGGFSIDTGVGAYSIVCQRGQVGDSALQPPPCILSKLELEGQKEGALPLMPS